MSMPLPIELVLAAHDFECPCMMSVQYGCESAAVFVVTFGHADGTPHCDPAAKLPLCADHTRAAQLACAGGPLMEILGASPPPDCGCGRPVIVQRVTTLRGEPV